MYFDVYLILYDFEMVVDVLVYGVDVKIYLVFVLCFVDGCDFFFEL